MKGWVFDPNRLACSPREQERRGYAMAARLLREYLGGGDIFAEVRERADSNECQTQAAAGGKMTIEIKIRIDDGQKRGLLQPRTDADCAGSSVRPQGRLVSIETTGSSTAIRSVRRRSAPPESRVPNVGAVDDELDIHLA